MLYTYTTERLILKVLDEDAAALTAEFFRKNQEYFSPWETDHPPEYYTEQYQERMLAAEAVHRLRSQAVRYYFFLPRQPAPIGTAGFSRIERFPESSCRLGYRLDRDFTGRGYMTEALRFLIPKIFFFYRLHRMEVNIMPENKPSLRLAERLGFRPEGTARELYPIGGVYRDHLRYSLLSGDIFPDASYPDGGQEFSAPSPGAVVPDGAPPSAEPSGTSPENPTSIYQ